MLGYLFLDIICCSKLTIFLKLHSRKTVRFGEEIVSAKKYQVYFCAKIMEYRLHNV